MKLSIITINRNNAAGLRKTMESVFSQTYKDFEYIVVDGASTDESVEVIREYESVNCSSVQPLPFTWISEPDTGIYNAMNKGCRIAKGEYTLMLNSADCLVDKRVLEKIIPELHDDDIIQGNEIYEKNGSLYRDKGLGKSDLLFNDVLDGIFHHQVSFISNSLLEQMGYYDDSYKKGADTYFFINSLGLHNASFRYVDVDVANFDMNGIYGQQDPKWIAIGEQENKRFYDENIPIRLQQFYKEASKRFRVYDLLKRNRIIWNLAMILVLISEKIMGPIRKEIVEKID